MGIIFRLIRKNVQNSVMEQRSLSSKFIISFSDLKTAKTWKSVLHPYLAKHCSWPPEVVVLLYKHIKTEIFCFIIFYATGTIFVIWGLRHRNNMMYGNENGSKTHIGHPFEKSVTNIVAYLGIFCVKCVWKSSGHFVPPIALIGLIIQYSSALASPSQLSWRLIHH